MGLMQTVKAILSSLIFSTLLFAAPSDDFLIEVKTDNPGVSADTEFTIPIVTTNGLGYNVDCNDDNTTETTGETGSYTCSYGSPGTYTIRIIDNNGNKKGFRRIQFGAGTDAEKLLDIQQWGTAIWSSMSSAFRDANHTTVSATDVPDLSGVRSLSSMFRNCILADPDTSGWDISNITNLSYMFHDATSANPDVGSWDTSLVQNFSGLFYNAVNATPITTTSGNIWNTGNATRMSSMFRGAAAADPDTSGWDVSNVTTMAYMFREASNANPDVSGWNTSNVESFSAMFYKAVTAQPVTTTSGNVWNTGSALRMDNMFREASDANPDVSGWDTSKVENFYAMFYKAVNAQPVTTTSGNIWNTGSAIRMDSMFREATDANPDVSGWDTSKVENFYRMFNLAVNAQPVTTTSGNVWNTGSALRMDGMFREATDANPDVSGWDTSKVENFSTMFYKANNAQPVTTTSGNVWNTGSALRMDSMFREATDANPNVSSWDTSKVENFYSMFRNASNANPDVSNWNTSQATDIGSMFRNASLFDRNMSGWDVSSITSAGNFLRGVQLTQTNYDALLLSWGSQAVQTGVSFHGGTSQYCNGKSGKDSLINSSWSIHDGGENCGGVCASAVGELTENHWTTISFPCSTGSNGIESLIGTAIGGTYGDNDNWVVYEQRGDYSGSSDSMVLLDAADPVEPAKGYWIISDHNTTWHIDGGLSDLNYTSTVTASSLGISSPNFDYVHLRSLPDTAADEQKLLLGNPFPHDINLSDIYFSGAGTAFSPMDGNANNDPYVNDVVYTYDHVGDDQSAYQAVSASTPGFDTVIHQQGFWLRLKPGQVDTNRITFPQTK